MRVEVWHRRCPRHVGGVFLMKELPGRYRDFRRQFPAISGAYDDLGRMIAETSPLDEKQTQLIKLGMAVASGQGGEAHAHARRALEAGDRPEGMRQGAR